MLSTLYYFVVKCKLIWAKKETSSGNWTCYTNTLVFWSQYLSICAKPPSELIYPSLRSNTKLRTLPTLCITGKLLTCEYQGEDQRNRLHAWKLLTACEVFEEMKYFKLLHPNLGFSFLPIDTVFPELSFSFLVGMHVYFVWSSDKLHMQSYINQWQTMQSSW